MPQITQRSTKPPLLKLNFLSHGTLEVRDLHASRRFYEEVLGFEVIQHAPVALLLRLGGDHTYVVVQTRRAKGTGFFNHNGIDVSTEEDVRAAYEALVSAKDDYGIQRIEKPCRRHGAFTFFFADPDGNWWEILANQRRGYSPAFDDPEADLTGRTDLTDKRPRGAHGHPAGGKQRTVGEGSEARRARHLTDTLALVPDLIDRLEWPADRLAAHRDQRLRELLRLAVARSPWHRKRLASVDPGAVDVAGIADLPAMTKTDLMEHYDEIVTDDRLTLASVEDHLGRVLDEPYLLDGYTAIASGGSTGTRGVFVYDWRGWSTYWVGLFRYLLRAAGTEPAYDARPMKMAMVAAAHFTHASAAVARSFTSDQIAITRLPVTLPVDEIVAGLNHVQPDVFFAYPSALPSLVREARATRLRITPSRIITCAEPLFPEIRAAAEETWGVRVGNWWATSEGGANGIACAEGRTHLSEDLMIIEPVDEAGRSVPAGSCSAKVYLTNLYNAALPLIRYEITDQVTFLPDPCPCGSAHRVVADIQGRLDDTFDYGGVTVNAHLFRSALGKRAAIVEYQVRQTGHGADIAVRSPRPFAVADLEAEIAAALGAVGVPHPVVNVTVVDRLDRGETGKLKRFVAFPAR
jgi:phenylacetate-coenzyme A ligase PaaK-like adenylate-forming protein/catechol 2,3-dioxygenase-like lactoylglutathione lyase family enzyme